MHFLNLCLFGDGTGEASAEAAETAAAGQNEGEKEQGSTAAAKASFEDLIKGEYKEDYDKSVQKLLNRRFAKAKADTERLNTLDPVIRTLADKYGVDPTDVNALVDAVNGDNSLIEEKAFEMGLTPEQYRNIAKINYENERLKAQATAVQREAQAQAQLEKWNAEAEQVKQSFPDFDFQTALQNEDFSRLLKAGVDVKSAYFATNADGILSGAMKYTAQTVAQKTADTIAARGNRPTENGLSSQASARVETDVSKLTNQQIAELVARASRGETIRFSG